VAAELFNNSAWFFMWLMVRVSQWCAQFPGGCFSLASPSAIGFVLYYAVLVSVMAGWLVHPRLRGWVAAGLAAWALAWAVQRWQRVATTRLSILPLNGGEAVYFQPAGRSEDLLIDCGDASSFEFIVKPFLRGQGVNHLGGLVLTHGDVHNVGAAETVQALFSPARVWLNAVAFRSTAYRQVRDHFERIPGLSEPVHRGHRIATWEVLHPGGRETFPQADDNALVLLTQIEGFRVLFLSDLGKPGQNELMRQHPKLQAGILVSGLPGQSEPVADALLNAVQPQLLVITDAEYPATARAGRKLRERLGTHSVPVLFTRETGGITLTFRRSNCIVRAANGLEMRLVPGGIASGKTFAPSRSDEREQP
jgi:beta-lactamase superfamily II metal-dependent hydrolase